MPQFVQQTVHRNLRQARSQGTKRQSILKDSSVWSYSSLQCFQILFQFRTNVFMLQSKFDLRFYKSEFGSAVIACAIELTTIKDFSVCEMFGECVRQANLAIFSRSNFRQHFHDFGGDDVSADHDQI